MALLRCVMFLFKFLLCCVILRLATQEHQYTIPFSGTSLRSSFSSGEDETESDGGRQRDKGKTI